MEMDDTASSPPQPAQPSAQGRRRTSAASEGGPTRTRLFTTPSTNTSSGGPSCYWQVDAWNIGRQVAKKRKGLSMPDGFERLTTAFEKSTTGLFETQHSTVCQQIFRV